MITRLAVVIAAVAGICSAMPAGCVASLIMIVNANAESGIASIYSYKGSQTASGESAHPGVLTAAHRTLAFGTRVQVTNKRNGKTVVVRINEDRKSTRLNSSHLVISYA